MVINVCNIWLLMSGGSVVGLPLVELRGNVNGYLAPYVVMHGGREKFVFGIKVGDFVYPVDITPFEDAVVDSLRRYGEVFSGFSCRGEEYRYGEFLRLGDEFIDFGREGFYEGVWAYVEVLSDLVDAVGLTRGAKEFLNYSRFYRVGVGADYVVRLGPSVFLDVRSYGGGAFASLRFTYPSLGVVYRSAWDVSRFSGGVKYIEPLRRLAASIVGDCGAVFFDLPVVSI